MGPLLVEYLNDNSRLSLPGLGTFYASDRPAEVQFASRLILPPSRSIEFQSRGFHDTDAAFVSYLCNRTGMPQIEAEDMLAGFSVHVRRLLGDTREFEIPAFGKLRFDPEGSCFFVPDSTRVTRLDSYGFRTLPAETVFSKNRSAVEREVPVIPLHPFDHTVRTTEPRTGQFLRRRNAGIISSAVAAAVALAVSAVFLLKKPEAAPLASRENNQPQEAALVPIGKPALPAPAVTGSFPGASSPAAGRASVSSTPEAPVSTAFFVVGGSFREGSQCRKAMAKWKQAGFEVSEHAHPSLPMTRVALGQFGSKAEALEFLRANQPAFDGSLWILAE